MGSDPPQPPPTAAFTLTLPAAALQWLGLASVAVGILGLATDSNVIRMVPTHTRARRRSGDAFSFSNPASAGPHAWLRAGWLSPACWAGRVAPDWPHALRALPPDLAARAAERGGLEGLPPALSDGALPGRVRLEPAPRQPDGPVGWRWGLLAAYTYLQLVICIGVLCAVIYCLVFRGATSTLIDTYWPFVLASHYHSSIHLHDSTDYGDVLAANAAYRARVMAADATVPELADALGEAAGGGGALPAGRAPTAETVAGYLDNWLANAGAVLLGLGLPQAIGAATAARALSLRLVREEGGRGSGAPRAEGGEREARRAVMLVLLHLCTTTAGGALAAVRGAPARRPACARATSAPRAAAGRAELRLRAAAAHRARGRAHRRPWRDRGADLRPACTARRVAAARA